MLLYLTSAPGVFDPPFAIKPEQRLTVLELGAGTGIVTSRMLKLTEDRPLDIIISTDLPEVCPLLHVNVNSPADAQAPCQAARVRPLAWGNAAHAADIARELGLVHPPVVGNPRYLTHILCSDLVYFPELLAPLLRTLLHLTSSPFIPPEATSAGEIYDLQIIISYKVRSLSKETAFWAAFGLWFAFEPVMARVNATSNSETDAGWLRLGASADSFVFVARRRPESQGWVLPTSDSDLMAGVGAWGSLSRKCDDTFETLLLMGLEEDDDR
ncbi:hypothetical protein HWV62_2294 [Athelia sp. TMB]|nr:hypothetical protein HWV62_2294 [Athelia sp. TMB]